MVAYASAKGAEEVAQVAQEVKLRAERKAGEFLADMRESGELKVGRPKEGNASTLEAFRINMHDSHRWQKLASMPEDRFEQLVAGSEEVTQSALVVAMISLSNPRRREPGRLRSAHAWEASLHPSSLRTTLRVSVSICLGVLLTYSSALVRSSPTSPLR